MCKGSVISSKGSFARGQGLEMTLAAVPCPLEHRMEAVCGGQGECGLGKQPPRVSDGGHVDAGIGVAANIWGRSHA